MNNIGFIGLGNMGKGMSINLSNNNLNVLAYDINDASFNSLSSHNIKKVDNLETLTKQAEVVITMLPDGQAVKDVWRDLVKFSKSNQYFIDCSTIDVATSIFVQNEAKKNGVFTLDAPVSGGVIGADNGTLTFMVGGNEKVYRKVEYLFNIMGNKSILCGNVGSGQSAKICNNMLLASTMVAVGESFKLGKNLGLDLHKLFDVLSTSSGSCWAINTYCPIKGVGPESPSDRDYKGGFSSALMYKDLSLAIEAAKQSNTDILYGSQTFEKFERLIENNKGDLDFSFVVNE